MHELVAGDGEHQELVFGVGFILARVAVRVFDREHLEVGGVTVVPVDEFAADPPVLVVLGEHGDERLFDSDHGVPVSVAGEVVGGAEALEHEVVDVPARDGGSRIPDDDRGGHGDYEQYSFYRSSLVRPTRAWSRLRS